MEAVYWGVTRVKDDRERTYYTVSHALKTPTMTLCGMSIPSLESLWAADKTVIGIRVNSGGEASCKWCLRRMGQ